MIVKRGAYKTKCGLLAVVGRLRVINKQWVAEGAIENPVNSTFCIHRWSINGMSFSKEPSSEMFDLMAEVK